VPETSAHVDMAAPVLVVVEPGAVGDRGRQRVRSRSEPSRTCHWLRPTTDQLDPRLTWWPPARKASFFPA